MNYIIENQEHLDDTNKLLKNIEARLNARQASASSTPQEFHQDLKVERRFNDQKESNIQNKILNPVLLSTQIMKDDMLISGYQQTKNGSSQLNTLRLPDSLVFSSATKIEGDADNDNSAGKFTYKTKAQQGNSNKKQRSISNTTGNWVEGTSMQNSIVELTNRESDRRYWEGVRALGNNKNNSQKKDQLIRIEEHSYDGCEGSGRERRYGKNKKDVGNNVVNEYQNEILDGLSPQQDRQLSAESLDYTKSLRKVNTSIKDSSQLDEELRVLKNRMRFISGSQNTNIVDQRNSGDCSSQQKIGTHQVTQIRKTITNLDQSFQNQKRSLSLQKQQDISYVSSKENINDRQTAENDTEVIFLLNKENRRLKADNAYLHEEVGKLKAKIVQINSAQKIQLASLEERLSLKHDTLVTQIKENAKNELIDKDVKIARLERQIVQFERQISQLKRDQINSSQSYSSSNYNSVQNYSRGEERISENYNPYVRAMLKKQNYNRSNDEGSILSQNYGASNSYLDDKRSEWNRSRYEEQEEKQQQQQQGSKMILNSSFLDSQARSEYNYWNKKQQDISQYSSSQVPTKSSDNSMIYCTNSKSTQDSKQLVRSQSSQGKVTNNQKIQRTSSQTSSSKGKNDKKAKKQQTLKRCNTGNSMNPQKMSIDHSVDNITFQPKIYTRSNSSIQNRLPSKQSLKQQDYFQPLSRPPMKF